MKTRAGAGKHAAARLLVCPAVLGVFLVPLSPSSAETASPWAEAHQSRARLVAGREDGAAPGAFVAGVEIDLPEGWKTYWRSPGETGVPPEFDWDRSGNLAAADVLYPAPKRLVDAGGTAFGYAGGVTFPVRVSAADPAKPVDLRLTFRYGICKDICIPAEASLALSLPPDGSARLSEGLAGWLDRVPRLPPALRPGDPVLIESRSEKYGADRRLVFRARFPGGAETAEAFLEGPGGAYLPPPERVSVEGEEAAFASDIGTVDVLTVAGKTAAVTLVGPKGQSAAAIKLD